MLCAKHTDLENRVAAPYPQIDSQVRHIEANFWQKVAAAWGFALQQQGFLHVIPMVTLTGYNLA